MSSERLVVTRDIDAGPEAVWAALLDHEGMSRWMSARVTLIAKRDNGGVGSVRRIRAAGAIVIDEEVVYASAPEGSTPGRLVYRIVRGVPVSFHRGEMLVERLGERRSRLTWDIHVASGIPGLARATVLALGPALRTGLRKLDGLLAA